MHMEWCSETIFLKTAFIEFLMQVNMKSLVGDNVVVHSPDLLFLFPLSDGVDVHVNSYSSQYVTDDRFRVQSAFCPKSAGIGFSTPPDHPRPYSGYVVLKLEGWMADNKLTPPRASASLKSDQDKSCPNAFQH